MIPDNVAVFDDASALAADAARLVAESAEEAVARASRFRLVLSGGTTPRVLYELLASERWRPRVPWRTTTVLFADERAVAPDHPDSNYRMVKETLLDALDEPGLVVARMRGEAEDLDEAARAYEGELATAPDLLVMGIGPDGHTASIFPRSSAALETQRRCVAVTSSPKPPPRRITLTPRALSEAHAAIVLATGADKAAAVGAALDARTALLDCPAALLRNRSWLVDRAAAARLG